MRIVLPSASIATILVSLTVVGLLPGCGGDEGGDSGGAGGVDASVETDTGAGLEDTGGQSDAGGGQDAASDSSSQGDGGGACPGAAGCSCQSNSDCDLAICLETSKGKVCAAACTDSSSCGAGEVCSPITVPGGDTQTVCVERAVHWCDPCKTNAACGGPGLTDAACVDRGAKGAFCGLACGGDLPECPSGSICQSVKDIEGKDVKQCMPEIGQACPCSPLAISKELATNCTQGSPDNKACNGVKVCLAAGKEGAPEGGGLSECIGVTPAEEQCNAVDDDCDGSTDEEVSCDDNQPCTADVCDGGKCTNNPSNGTCDDGDPCTEKDSCADGKCAGSSKTCDDGDSCTTDSCDPTQGCVFTPVTGPCDDGDACTADDACDAGTCTGKKKSCDDGNACTVDTCDPGTGACSSKTSTGSCDDGNPCTEGDTCKPEGDNGALICVAGTPKKCDDNNPCTLDSCDPAQGCVGKVDTSATVPCYTGAPGTKGVGVCKEGTQACKQDGSLGACEGETTPAAKETCDGKDETCDGQTDENCVGGGPPVVVWTMGSAVVDGNSGGKGFRVLVGGGVSGSASAPGNTSVELGFYAWLSQWLK